MGRTHQGKLTQVKEFALMKHILTIKETILQEKPTKISLAKQLSRELGFHISTSTLDTLFEVEKIEYIPDNPSSAGAIQRGKLYRKLQEQIDQLKTDVHRYKDDVISLIKAHDALLELITKANEMLLTQGKSLNDAHTLINNLNRLVNHLYAATGKSPPAGMHLPVVNKVNVINTPISSNSK